MDDRDSQMLLMLLNCEVGLDFMTPMMLDSTSEMASLGLRVPLRYSLKCDAHPITLEVIQLKTYTASETDQGSGMSHFDLRAMPTLTCH
jgi:hypothetical protein